MNKEILKQENEQNQSDLSDIQEMDESWLVGTVRAINNFIEKFEGKRNEGKMLFRDYTEGPCTTPGLKTDDAFRHIFHSIKGLDTDSFSVPKIERYLFFLKDEIPNDKKENFVDLEDLVHFLKEELKILEKIKDNINDFKLNNYYEELRIRLSDKFDLGPYFYC